jgi:hypothetical protein
MSTFDNTNPYNSTLYNNTPLDTQYDKQWMEMEKTLFENKQPPYHNLNVTENFVGFMGQDNESDLLTKRKENRIKRQQEKYTRDAAGTMSQQSFQDAFRANQNTRAFNLIAEEGQAFESNVDYVSQAIKEGKWTGGKSRKSKKSKQSKKLNKSKKSKNSRKSRKSKK